GLPLDDLPRRPGRRPCRAASRRAPFPAFLASGPARQRRAARRRDPAQRPGQFRRGDRRGDRPRLHRRVQPAFLVHNLPVDAVRAQLYGPGARRLGRAASRRRRHDGHRYARIVGKADRQALSPRQAGRSGARPLSSARPGAVSVVPHRLGPRQRCRGRCWGDDRVFVARARRRAARMIRRRDLLLAGLALPLVGRAAGAVPASALRDIAASRGLTYGTYVRAEMLDKDRVYTDVVTREAALIVCSCAHWRHLAPTATTTDYSGVEAAYAWARAHRMAYRGHALLWGEAAPGWFAELPDRAAAIRAVEAHVTGTCRHFAGRFHSWDVVNEPLKLGD